MPSEVVSNSQLKTFKRCRRKYWLTFVRRLKTRRYAKTGARQLGTRVHGALDAYYPLPGTDLHLNVGDVDGPTIVADPGGLASAMRYLEKLKQQESAEAGEDSIVIEAINKEHDLAVAMLEGYDQWIQEEGVDSDLETVAKEQLLRTPSPVAGVELIGKLDRIVRRVSTSDIGFMDYKTTGSLQDPLKHLGMDEQFRMYALMQRLLGSGTNVRFQIYRMLKKSKRTQTAKPPFFADYEVYINDEELRGFWARLHGEITELLRFERMIEANPELHRSIAYPSPTTDCSWDCDFYSVCPLFDDDRSDPEHVLMMNFEPGDPHAHYDGQLQSG